MDPQLVWNVYVCGLKTLQRTYLQRGPSRVRLFGLDPGTKYPEKTRKRTLQNTQIKKKIGKPALNTKSSHSMSLFQRRLYNRIHRQIIIQGSPLSKDLYPQVGMNEVLLGSRSTQSRRALRGGLWMDAIKKSHWIEDPLEIPQDFFNIQKSVLQPSVKKNLLQINDYQQVLETTPLRRLLQTEDPMVVQCMCMIL